MKDYLASIDTSVALPKAVEVGSISYHVRRTVSLLEYLQAALQDLKSPVKKLISSNSAVPLSPRQFAEKQAAKPKGAMTLLERV